MKRLVADTGPILHLHEAGALPLLPLIGEIFLPPLVITELHAHAPGLWPDAMPAWAKLEPISSHAQQRALEWKSAGLLHGGEAEALSLAIEIKPDWFLTDDAAARLMAESLGMEARGSLGVVLWVAAKRLISKTEAQTHLTALENSSLWMSRRVQIEARAALEKLFVSS
jgi:predicted nucleic acid-binding protein